ncbi:MAG TPA: glycosyltransferase family 39 protein [Paenirhodobacter sp.]
MISPNDHRLATGFLAQGGWGVLARNPVACAVLCVVIVAAMGLGLRPLTAIDETRYLAVAWEMHLSGNGWVPSKNFAPYSDKPPLLFWAINLVWMLTDVSEFAARMVVPVAAGAAIWLTARLAARLWPEDRAIGGRAALALAGLGVFAVWGGLTMFDVPLMLAVLAGVLCLVRADNAARGAYAWLGFGAAIGVGVLTKGPVILFHLLPLALTLPLWGRGGMAWRRLAPGLGLAMLCAAGLVALWLVPAALLGGAEYRTAILWHQSAGRMAASFAHARPWWFYLAALPVLVFPLGWTPALWRAGRRADWRGDMGLRLALIWIAAALVLFSLTSGKQVHYLVPELPALALIAARMTRAMRPFWTAMAVVAAGVLGVNLLIGMTRIGTDYSSHPIAAALAPWGDDGLAYVGAPYHAQFNFAARLRAPVATPADAEELAAWMAAHRQGRIVGRQGAAAPAWPARQVIRFDGADYGIWAVAGAAQMAPSAPPLVIGDNR